MLPAVRPTPEDNDRRSLERTMDSRDYPDHFPANQQKTLAPSGISAIASSIPILHVHAEPARHQVDSCCRHQCLGGRDRTRRAAASTKQADASQGPSAWGQLPIAGTTAIAANFGGGWRLATPPWVIQSWQQRSEGARAACRARRLACLAPMAQLAGWPRQGWMRLGAISGFRHR
jgi:hypothetical protein